ncbi:MAG: Uma2 family endonuclease [Planctomycetota bacterium]|nr:Uma2 family endonuclease [Planctomycetota bacterium]
MKCFPSPPKDTTGGAKFEKYRQIESLQEYVLIAQEKCHVERFARQEDGIWVLWETNELQDTLDLNSVECSLPLASVYERVTLES